MSCVRILVLQMLVIGSALSQTTQSAEDQIQTAFTTMKILKSNFENIKLKRERNYRNQLISEVNRNANNLYSSLDEEVFKPEDNAAIALLEALKDTPERNCLSRLRDYISEIRNKESRSEYNYCIADVNSEANQVTQKLSEAQENVNTLSTQAEQKINQCQRVYNLRANITLLQECLTEALDKMRKVSTELDVSLQGLTNSQFANNVARCVDRTVLTVKKALNTNYDLISKCFGSFNSSLGKRISALVLSYKLNMTSNAQNAVATALANLKANPSVILESITNTRVKVEETLSNRSRNTDTISVSLASNDKVIAYQRALYNASQELATYNNVKGCLETAHNKYRDNINTRSNEMKNCLNGIRQTISTGDVNSLENNVLERQISEAQVAVIACLSSSGTVVTSNIAVCSAQADVAFEIYLASVQLKLDEINKKAEVIRKQINSCEQYVLPALFTTQVANKFLFQDCLLSRSLNYTLQIE